jgi:hypothetical protein
MAMRGIILTQWHFDSLGSKLKSSKYDREIHPNTRPFENSQQLIKRRLIYIQFPNTFFKRSMISGG